MVRKAHRVDINTRQHIAQEAARLISEHGIKDFLMAKQKAANNLGISDKQALPSNVDIEKAILEHHRLFHSDSQPQYLNELRQTALKAMHLLKPYEPRLVGSVQRGTAGEYSDVNLHLFSDYPKSFGKFLDDHTIPYEQSEKRLRINKDNDELYPCYRFIAGDIPIDIVLFPIAGQRQAPLSPVDGCPMQRDDIKKVEAAICVSVHDCTNNPSFVHND